jgi:hypothetical protein
MILVVKNVEPYEISKFDGKEKDMPGSYSPSLLLRVRFVADQPLSINHHTVSHRLRFCTSKTHFSAE